MPRTVRWVMLFLVGLTLFMTGCREQGRDQALAEGSRLAAAGNAKGAMVVYKALLERDPKDSQARYELASAYLALGKSKQAEKEAQQLADSPNPPSQLPLLIARIRVALNQTEEALKELAGYLSRNPDSAEAWEVLGHAYFRVDNLPEAAKAYQQSLSLNPGQIEARIGLAGVRLDQGQLSQARAELDVLLAANPDNYRGLRLLGQVEAMSNDFAGAMQTYERIVAKFPNDIEARYYGAFYRFASQGAFEGVEGVARKLMTDFPNRPEGFKLQGLLELTRGASAQAVSNFQQALRLRSDIQTNYYLAQAYERDGRLEMAISELGIVLDNSPQQVQPRQLLARLHFRMGRPEAARAELEKILQLKPEDAQAKRMLGDIYLLKGQFDKSLGYYEAIPEDAPQAIAAQLQKSRILVLLGHVDQAEAQLRQALARRPDSLEGRLTLAGLLNKRQRPDAAAAVLDQEGLSQADAALAHLAKAGILARQGRTDEALGLLERAKALDPALTAAYCLSAAISFQVHDTAKAVEQYRELLIRFPEDPVAHAALAACLEEEGSFEEARTHLEQAAKSRQCDIVLDLVAFLVRRDNLQSALKVLGDCRGAQGDHLPALVAMARLQAALGDAAASLATIQKIEAIDQDTALAERFRLSVYRKDWQRAATEATRLMERHVASANDMARAVSLVEEGDLSGAQRIVRQSFAAEPSVAGARLGLVALLLQMGRTQEAARYFDASASTAPASGMATAPGGEAGQYVAQGDSMVWNRQSMWRRDKSIPMVLNTLSMIYADKPSLVGKALEYAMAANVLEGDNPIILDTLGYALLKNDRQPDAIFILQEAAFLAPNNEDISRHLSMAIVYKD